MREEPTGRTEGAASGRRTPYELVFADGAFEPEVFPRIRQEARERDVDATDLERFGFLTVVGDALRSVLPEAAPPEALEQYRALLYQAYHFWLFERRVYVLEPAVARYLVEASPGLGGWELQIPYPSVYLQLPSNLFWSSISPDSVPEPVDGFFVTLCEGTDAAGRAFRRLEVLVTLGIRRDRAGFSVMPFTAEVGPGVARVWAETPGRDGGRDFENVLPGGEVAGLYSLLTTAETLKLIARAFWFIAGNPAAVSSVAEPAAPVAGPGAPPLPRLPYFRVSLGEGRGAEGGGS